MRDIVIRGSGGLAQEVALLIERINQVKPLWNILGYIDEKDIGTTKYGYKVLGNDQFFLDYRPVCCAIAVANPLDRQKILNELAQFDLEYPTLIDPSAIVGKDFECGKGCIIQSNCVLTADVKLGNFTILNIGVIIGHNSRIGSFCMINPSCNVSGGVEIGDYSFFGTGSIILQYVQIGKGVTVGAGSVVLSDVKDHCTMIGIPAREKI